MLTENLERETEGTDRRQVPISETKISEYGKRFPPSLLDLSLIRVNFLTADRQELTDVSLTVRASAQWPPALPDAGQRG